MSVGDALKKQPKQPVLVEGHYLKRGGVVQLCDQLVGAVPESCAGLTMPGYRPPSEVEVQQAGDVAWTPDSVEVLGEVSGQKLRVGGCA
jgi:hypothetical protein